MPIVHAFGLILAAVLSLAAGGSDVTAFVHANVVPMDSERVLRDQTVVVSGGRFAIVGRPRKRRFRRAHESSTPAAATSRRASPTCTSTSTPPKSSRSTSSTA